MRSLKVFFETIEPSLPCNLIEIGLWQSLKELGQTLPFTSNLPFSRVKSCFVFIVQGLSISNSVTELITPVSLSYLLESDFIEQHILPNYTKLCEEYSLFSEQRKKEAESQFFFGAAGALGGREPLPLTPSHFDSLQNIWLAFNHNSATWSAPSIIFQLKNLEQELNTVSRREAIVFFSSLLLEENILIINKELRNAINELPQNSNVGFIAGLPPSKVTDIKLTVYDIKLQQILDYLKSVGWKGSIVELEKLVLPLSELHNDIALDLSFNQAGISSKVALKFNFPGQAKDFKNWEQTFEYLVEKNLISSSKIETFLTFLNWKFESSFVTSNTSLLILEIIFELNSPIEVQAYLGFSEIFADF